MAREDQHPPATGVDGPVRRDLLRAAALTGAAGLALDAPAAASAARADPVPSPTLVARSDTALVETRQGKVAGYLRHGIATFKGLPYGDTTAGENRFRPSAPPKPWRGVRSSRHYGPVCPQDKGTGRFNDEEAFLFQWNDSVEAEDCLRLNVWTPGLNDGVRRPVMVWLHGGGFAAGSGHDLPAFDGENLARRGDVVVVTLNHRLNLLGFLDLSLCGEDFAASGNVGMLDIVAALQWVRDNITAFGGDPDRVLIFGQSGGGGKVSALMGMPAAKGLFHAAIVQSGSFARMAPIDRSRRLTDLILAELGLGRGDARRLQALPYMDLRRASEAVVRRENPPPGRFLDVIRNGRNLGFAPVVDGVVLPAAPFAPHAPLFSADVPLIIGTTQNEFVTGINHPEYEFMTEAELAANVAATFPGREADILAAFRRRTPEASPFDLWSRIATGPIRASALSQAASKAALGRAPAYLYRFDWRTPILDGRPRAFHCADIPFAFFNTDRCETMTGGGAQARALSGQMADAFVRFARTGDPNPAGRQAWAKFEPRSAPCLVFDDPTRLERGADAEEIRSLGPDA
jgi:para-nitrobenzyl esterase